MKVTRRVLWLVTEWRVCNICMVWACAHKHRPDDELLLATSWYSGCVLFAPLDVKGELPHIKRRGAGRGGRREGISWATDIYIYIWRLTELVPTFLGLKPIFPPKTKEKTAKKSRKTFCDFFGVIFVLLRAKHYKNRGFVRFLWKNGKKNLAKRAFRAFCKCHTLLSAEMLNMLNHVGCKPPKKRFFLLKCWTCWICWMFFGP